MRKGEIGQAFILVLILLAIGALLIVPALRLTGTSLKSSQILARQVRAMYAADGAQEYVLWKLVYDPGYAASFTYDGQSDNFTVDLCGKSVDVMIVMRATPGQGGVTLATEHVIRPTKTVDPDTIPNDVLRTCTYTIKLEQLSENTTQGLDAIYDILPKTFQDTDYVPDSSEISVDGGAWESVPDPSFAVEGGQVRLRWPASGNFTSPIRDFEVRQVKELKFQVTHEFKGEDKDMVLCNWVVLKPWNTVSGPQAPITVGSPSDPGLCKEGGLLEVDKTSDPEVIEPGVEEDIEYTISITNLDVETHHIQSVTDYLPPGFSYTDNSTSGIITEEPVVDLETINGVERCVLEWEPLPAVPIASGETLTLTFWAYVIKDVSGSYYNEVIALPDVHAPTIFSEIGVSDEEYYACYTWNTGAVIVPAYDARTDADDVYIDANMALTLDGISITSWQIY